MVNIEYLKQEITDRIKALEPEKIFLFGSYACGTATEDSDIDLCIIKSVDKKEARELTLKARKLLRDLIFKYQIGFDIIAVSQEYIKEENISFYNEDIIANGTLIYG